MTMGLFGSVSGKDIDTFAKGLVQDLAKRYRPRWTRAASAKFRKSA
jgi:DNA-binding ferritin-like protein (Dps family)